MVNDLPQLIGDLEEWRRRIPLAASRAVNPKRWRVRARRRAEELLELLAANDEERQWAKQLAAAVTVAHWDRGNGMVWEMATPKEGFTIGQVRADETSGELFQGANRDQVNRLYQWVLRWVQTPEADGGKARDARDAGRDDRVIAWGLVNLLLGGGKTGNSFENEAKREGIIPHIQKFIDQHAREAIAPERLQRWLEAIASAWVEMILEDVPEAVADDVVAEWREISKK